MAKRGSNDGERRWRCFWAALMDAGSERRLTKAVARLRTRGANGLRWTPRENWHLTLHFLGPTDAAQISAMSAALERCALEVPIALPLRGIGPFPRIRPRTLAALLDTPAALLEWVRYLRDAAADVGLAPEARAYRAHLTVARPQRGSRPRYPAVELNGELRFDRVALMRSDPVEGGVVYTPLAGNPSTTAGLAGDPGRES